MSEQQPHRSPFLEANSSSLSALSAWVDGELPPQDWDATWQEACEGVDHDDDPLDIWHRYHLIGEVLRAPASAPVACTHAAQDSAALARRIVLLAQAPAKDQSHPSPVDQVQQAQDRVGQPAQVPLPVAVQAKPIVESAQIPSRREAANDGVFRWKMVSGLASVVAVMGVAWGVMGGVAQPHAVGPLLAQTPAPARTSVWLSSGSAQPVAQGGAPSTVWVSTPQGQVLRDPRLDALLLAHRQAGGASALQVPAGFLRSATFDSTQR